MIAAAGAVVSADRDRNHAAEKDEKDFGAIAKTEPQHGHRNERRFRQRIKQFHHRIEEDVEQPPARHQEPEAAAADDREQKPERAAIKRNLAVIDELAASDQVNPRIRHFAQRRQRRGVDEVESRDRFPGGREDDQRQITKARSQYGLHGASRLLRLSLFAALSRSAFSLRL